MDKLERFISLCKASKRGFLRAEVRCHTYKLSIFSNVGKRNVKMSTINLVYDLPVGVTPFGFVSMIMRLCKLGYLYVKEGCFEYVYIKKDLCRARRHFEHTDARDIFDRLIKRACERDRNNHFDRVSPAIEEVKNLASRIREEIYHLFRFFSDEELKSISRSMLGSSKHINSDVVKAQQLVKRISNYNDDIGETVELIEAFEKDFEKKHECYFTATGYSPNGFTDGPVTYKAVLNFIEAARKGSEDYYKQHQKQIV